MAQLHAPERVSKMSFDREKEKVSNNVMGRSCCQDKSSSGEGRTNRHAAPAKLPRWFLLLPIYICRNKLLCAVIAFRWKRLAERGERGGYMKKKKFANFCRLPLTKLLAFASSWACGEMHLLEWNISKRPHAKTHLHIHAHIYVMPMCIFHLVYTCPKVNSHTLLALTHQSSMQRVTDFSHTTHKFQGLGLILSRSRTRT